MGHTISDSPHKNRSSGRKRQRHRSWSNGRVAMSVGATASLGSVQEWEGGEAPLLSTGSPLDSDADPTRG